MYTFPIINMNKTGENICALRVQKGLSVRRLQAMLGFATPQAIYKWQQGLTLPSVDNLVALSSILETPIEKILVVDCPNARTASHLFISSEHFAAEYSSRPLPFPSRSRRSAMESMTPPPVIDMDKTGEKISALRMQKGLSVRKLQSCLGFATAQAIYKWQQGITLPSLDNLVALSTLFEVPVEDILAAQTPAVRAA